jgi:peptidylprolyl isomerase
MAAARKGDSVKVHYKGTLTDGTVFDDSSKREPLEFTIGSSRLIQGFEEAVEGMQVGEKKTVNLTAEQAYGPSRQEMIIAVPRSQVPADIQLQPGMQLTVNQENEQPVVVTVTSFDEKTVTLDGNHPLAGKDLVFEIKLVSIGPGCSCCH